MAMKGQPEDRGTTVMERVRAVHGAHGGRRPGRSVRLEGVAALAASETGGVVAIIVPRLGTAAASGPVAIVRACAGTSVSGRERVRPWSRPGWRPRCR